MRLTTILLASVLVLALVSVPGAEAAKNVCTAFTGSCDGAVCVVDPVKGHTTCIGSYDCVQDCDGPPDS